MVGLLLRVYDIEGQGNFWGPVSSALSGGCLTSSSEHQQPPDHSQASGDHAHNDTAQHGVSAFGCLLLAGLR